MPEKRPTRLTKLTEALSVLDDNALLDAWKAAVAMCESARSSRNGDGPSLRAATCESVAAARFGAGRHIKLYARRYGEPPQA